MCMCMYAWACTCVWAHRNMCTHACVVCMQVSSLLTIQLIYWKGETCKEMNVEALYKTGDGLDHGSPQRPHCRSSCWLQGKWTAAGSILIGALGWDLHLTQYSDNRESSSGVYWVGYLQTFIKILQVVRNRIVMERKRGTEIRRWSGREADPVLLWG